MTLGTSRARWRPGRRTTTCPRSRSMASRPGSPQLGLATGTQVDNKVMERVYGAFADPRDPAGEATLGRAPSGFAGHDEKISGRVAGLLASEPEATQERRNQIIMQSLKDPR